MYPYIETIKVKNGEVENLPFHQARFNRTRSELFGLNSHPELKEKIIIPAYAGKDLIKCRVIYDREIKSVEFHPYIPPEISSLKLISNNQINYSHKSADRKDLSTLYQQRGSCDDVLIVKKGQITDSFSANVVFWDGSLWFTPETPLLMGTMRASLLEKGVIREAVIRADHLSHYKGLKLINALNDWNDAPFLPIEAISL